jgi:hypothetical protein
MALKALQNIIGWILTASATLSIGFLAFAGMLIISPSLLLCGGAFILAAAYESQVNGVGISIALKRMFSKRYLRLGIAGKYLDDLLEDPTDELLQNVFFQDYSAQKKYITDLENHLDNLVQRKDSYLRIVDSGNRDEIQLDITNTEECLSRAKKNLHHLRSYFLNTISDNSESTQKT